VHRRRSRRGAAASRGALFTWVAPAAPGRRRTAAPDAQPLPTHSRSRRPASPTAGSATRPCGTSSCCVTRPEQRSWHDHPHLCGGGLQAPLRSPHLRRGGRRDLPSRRRRPRRIGGWLPPSVTAPTSTTASSRSPRDSPVRPPRHPARRADQRCPLLADRAADACDALTGPVPKKRRRQASGADTRCHLVDWYRPGLADLADLADSGCAPTPGPAKVTTHGPPPPSTGR